MNNLSPLVEKNYFINLIGSGISIIEKTVNVVIRIDNDKKISIEAIKYFR